MVDISFVIPALNEEKCIADTLLAIHSFIPKTLTYEILVGDHGSRDATVDLVNNHGATALSLPGGTVGELRNKVVNHSSGLVLIFNDADIQLTPKWAAHISSVINKFRDGERSVVGGTISPPTSSIGWLSKYWFSLASPRKYVGTGHMLITKDYFEEIGGFDPALSSGEDYEFCQRAKKMGFSVELEPSLQVIHNDFPTTLKQFFRREIWHGIGDFKSLSSFLSSRVALLSTAYTTLAALAITSLLFNYKIAPIFILAALSIPTACSIKKFPALQPDIRIGNLAIWNIYLFARFLSFFFKTKKKRPYETK